MREIFLKGCSLVDEWVARVGGWDDLPDKFDLSSEGWVHAEEEITKAANAGDDAKVQKLGDAFIERIATYLARWEEKMSRKAAA